MPPALQSMIGYSIYPQTGATAVIGHVDGRHPLKLLREPAGDEPR
jgi:hypothetical protein